MSNVIRVSSEVKHNGTAVLASGWTVEQDADHLTGNWSVELADPISVAKGDHFTITRSFGSSAASSIILDNGEVVSRNFTLGNNFTTSVSGRKAETVNPTSSAGIDLYFVSSEFMDLVAPYGWYEEQGVLYFKGAGNPGAGRPRIYYRDLLPKPNQEIGTFWCYVGTLTHHWVGAELARRLDLELRVNTPDLSVQRVLHVPGTDSLFEAISKLFGIWNPTIHVIKNASGRNELQVLDTAGPNQTKTQPRTISLANRAVSRIEMSSSGPQKTEIIDHVIVLGAKGVNRTIIEGSGNDDTGTNELSAVEYEENFAITVPLSHTRANRHKQMGDYKKRFNSGAASEEDQLRPATTIHSQFFWKNPDNKNEKLLLREITESFSAAGEIIQRTEIKHKFSQSKKEIRTQEALYQNAKIPGETRKKWRMTRNKIVDHSSVNKVTGIALVTEMVEELVLASYQYDPQTGNYYYAAPQPLANAQNQVSANKNTVQKLIEMNTHYKKVMVNRATEGQWVQTTIDYDVINETTKVNAQALNDPTQNSTTAKKDETQYKKEFHNGAGPYHKATTIEHPDIIDDAVAQAIADRVFARSGSQEGKEEFTIVLAVPMMFDNTAYSVTLQPMSVYVVSRHGSAVRTIPGGTYTLVGTRESMKMGKGSVDYEMSLKVRSVL